MVRFWWYNKTSSKKVLKIYDVMNVQKDVSLLKK
jgi:hypothetical protein